MDLAKSKHLGIRMRGNCLALVVFVLLAASQCQGYDNIESPLSVELNLENTKCNESIQFGSGIFEAAKLETFKLNITNNGDEPIRNIEIFALMPKGMKYIDSSYSFLGERDLEEILEPKTFDETRNTRIRWSIGSLQANEIKSILIRAHLKCPIKEAQIELAAFGDKSDRSVKANNTWKEPLEECNCTSILTTIQSPLRIYASLNDAKCGEVEFNPGKIENAGLEAYKLDVQNIGEKPISDLIAMAVLSKGMKYANSSFSEAREGRVDVVIQPQEFNETQNTKIIWNLGNLQANELKSILLNSYLKCPGERAHIELMAIGNVGSQSVNASSIWNESINLKNCDCSSTSTKIIERPLLINVSLNDTKCGEVEFSPGKMEVGRIGIFKIDVQNAGEKPIGDLMAVAVMPKGMKYASSSYSETREDRPEVIVKPQEYNETQNTRIIWNVGSLQANELRSILLDSYFKCPVDRANIELTAIGNVASHSINATKNEPIDLGICDCTGGNIDINLQVCELNNSTKANFGRRCLEPARLDLYNISVTNNGDISLKNVKVIAEMNEGMMFENSTYSDSLRGNLKVVQIPNVFDENQKTKLVWSMGDLLPWESKSIILAVFLNRNVTDRDIFAMVQGYSAYSPENEPIIDFAETASDVYELRTEFGAPCPDLTDLPDDLKEALKETCNKKECPSWVRNFNLTMLVQSQKVGGGNNFTMNDCVSANASLLNANIIATCANASANNTTVTFSL